MTALSGSAGTCMVLELDPDLGSDIGEHDWESARRACRAQLVHVPPGRWDLPAEASHGLGDITALVLVRGVLAREHALAEHRSLELLCGGDVLLLPAPISGAPVPSGHTSLTALSQATLMVLGGTFLAAAGRWPSLLATISRRLEAQRARLAVQGLAIHLPRAADRVLLTLWLLADACGRVSTEGIIIPLDLTHDVIGQLTAARRPTVTLALGELQSSGCLRRDARGHLVLTDRAQQEVMTISGTEDGGPIGPNIRLRELR